jgi:hypothetical protein
MNLTEPKDLQPLIYPENVVNTLAILAFAIVSLVSCFLFWFEHCRIKGGKSQNDSAV